MLAHRTQFGEDNPFRKIPPELMREFGADEHFIQVYPEPDASLRDNHEVIVVDDDSPDGTAAVTRAVAKSHPHAPALRGHGEDDARLLVSGRVTHL